MSLSRRSLLRSAAGVTALLRAPFQTTAASNITIRVELPDDRTKAGRLTVIGPGGARVAGPWDVLGKADGQTAKNHGNPGRNTLTKYGDTPTGTYNVLGAFKVGAGTNYKAHSYGDFGALRLDPVAGDAKQAKDLFMRDGLLIHAGDPGAGGKLRPTNGCLRMSNADMKALLNELAAIALVNNAIAGVCAVSSVSVSVSGATAAPDDGYDEGDPPPILAGSLPIP